MTTSDPFGETATPPANDETMFGCECALPFLVRHADVLGRRSVSGLALGAVMAFGACDMAPDTPPQTPPQDKVSEAFTRADREIARAKARWSGDNAVARHGADAGSAPRP